MSATTTTTTRRSELARLQSEVALLTVRVATLERALGEAQAALAWIQAGRGAPDADAVRGELDEAVRVSDAERAEPHRL